MDVFFDEFWNLRCRFWKLYVIMLYFFNFWCEKCVLDGKCIIMCVIVFLIWLCVRSISYNKMRWINFKCLVVWRMCFFNVYYDEICDVGKIVNNFVEFV